jgi:hypothetical protein
MPRPLLRSITIGAILIIAAGASYLIADRFFGPTSITCGVKGCASALGALLTGAVLMTAFAVVMAWNRLK